MDENQFWANVWRTAAIAIVATVSVMAGCTANNTAAIKHMVAEGSNPIDAMCALNGSSTNPQCLARAVGKCDQLRLPGKPQSAAEKNALEVITKATQ